MKYSAKVVECLGRYILVIFQTVKCAEGNMMFVRECIPILVRTLQCAPKGRIIDHVDIFSLDIYLCGVHNINMIKSFADKETEKVTNDN